MVKYKLFYDRRFLHFFSFFFPFFVFVSAFAITGIFPFGERTILSVDSYHQYAPFLCELRRKLLSGSSLFYSWNNGLGNEFYATFANYSSSPLNLFVIFFSSKNIPIFIWMVTAIRAGLASLFMSLFLKKIDENKYDMIVLLFSFSYALCGWFTGFFWNIMWCDGFVLLPLISLGLYKLIIDRKPFLYIISLGLSILSNFYVGFFHCIFVVLFAPVIFFSFMPSEELKPKRFFGAVIRFIGASLIAGMIGSIILIPTYLILQNSSAVKGTFPKDLSLTGTLLDFLGRFLVSANPNIRDGMANVSCGIVVIMLIPLFFFADPIKSNINLRKKLSFGLLILILYLSFTNRTLNYIWHGFHFPNQIPYRESFIMCFVLCLMAFIVIRSLRSFSKGQVTAAFISLLAFLVLYEKFGEGTESYIQIGLSLLFIIVQGVVITAIVAPRNHEKTSKLILALSITMMSELLISSVVSVALVGANEGFPLFGPYGRNGKLIESYVDELEGQGDHYLYERTEVYPNYSCNINSVYGVKGVSIFSSTARESVVDYISNFGFHNNGINSIRNQGFTRVTATLLGIRNLIMEEDTMQLPRIFDQVDTLEGDIEVFDNPDALSVGFVCSDDIISYVPVSSNVDVFNKTNDLVRAMGIDKDVYLPVTITGIDSEGLTIGGNRGNGLIYYYDNNPENVSFTISVDPCEVGDELYLYVHSNRDGQISYGDINYATKSYQIISLGLSSGEVIEPKITFSKTPTTNLNVMSYRLNREGYDLMVETLSREMLQVTSYDDTYIRGVADIAEDNSFMFFTIPYSDGFQVSVDGVKTEVVPVGDNAFFGIYLDQGHHEIDITYKLIGFEAGISLTALGLVLLILWMVSYRLVMKRKMASVISRDNSSEEEADASEIKA